MCTASPFTTETRNKRMITQDTILLIKLNSQSLVHNNSCFRDHRLSNFVWKLIIVIIITNSTNTSICYSPASTFEPLRIYLNTSQRKSDTNSCNRNGCMSPRKWNWGTNKQ